MKIVICGDTHHRSLWEDIVAKEKPDVLVLNGDFFDSREKIGVNEGIFNFNKILDFKRAEDSKPDGIKVILNIGNHDFYYFKDVSEVETIWSYFPREIIRIRECIEASRDLMQMAYLLDEKTIVSHAGISSIWLENNKINSLGTAAEIVEAVNKLWLENPRAFNFTPGKNQSDSGDDETQSSIWIRIPSLSLSSPAGIDQIIGHTTHDNITGYKTFNGDTIIACDTLGTSREYIVVENGTLIPTIL